MSDTATRSSSLDAFAEMPIPEATRLPAVIASAAPPPMIVHGAQLIAGNKRDQRMLMDEIDAMASMMGDEVFYSIPFKDKRKGTVTHVEGVSIDGAMMVHNAYGNAGVHAWVHSEGYDYWDIIAIWQDHEKGIEVSRMFRQRKGASRMGGGDEGRNQEAALQIGISKAQRNVISNALRYLCNRAHRVAKAGLADKIGRDIEGWRRRIVARLAETNIPLDRVEMVIGRPAKDWLTLDIVKVIERAKAVADGEASLDDTFPPIKHDPTTGEILDKFASSGGVLAATGEATAPAPAPPTGDPDRAVAAPDKTEIVQRMLALASSQKDGSDRLEELELLQVMLLDMYPDADMAFFVRNAIMIAVKAVKGEVTMKDARRYLEAMAR